MKKFIIGLILSSAALWWAFRDIDWAAFKLALVEGNGGMILLGAAVLLTAVPLRGIRWSIFLQPIKRVSWKMTSGATLVGYFGNNALPFRLGEVLRSYYLSRQVNVPMSQVFGTVIVERFLDAISLLVLLAFLPLFEPIPESLRAPVLWSVLVSLILTAMTYWIVKRRAIPLLRGRLILRGRLKTLADNLRLGFTSLRHGRHYLPLFILTLLIWALYLVSLYIIQRGLGLGLSMGQTYLILVATSLVLGVPAAPGFVGTYHAAVILVLVNIYGLDLATGQAAAVVFHAYGFIPYTIFGASIYFRSHLHLHDVKGITLEPDQGVHQ